MTAPEPVFFSQYFESLFLRAHGDQLTPRLKARLREAGLDVDRLLPAYPVSVGKAALQIAVEEIYPGQDREAALREMGRRFLRGWQSTLLGRAAAAVLRVVGPRRSLMRLEGAFRTGDNFTRIQAEELGPTRVRLRINHVLGAPAYYAGMMQEGGVMTGAKNTRATVESTEGDGAVILVEWDP
ncbi:MAG: DUF2378 family protein [Myxococcaceae bacterium]|nr:DUF2378 family protein [Myxococcaceae bacterium]